MTYLYIKSLHIIFVVSWFAGLFYMIRLYIYEVEALDKSAQERDVLVPQFRMMQGRLWHIITWPASILATIFGIWMLFLMDWLQFSWMHLKLSFVAVLFAYQIYSYKMYRDFGKGIYRLTSNQLRIWNEGATLLLFAIVFLVVLKNSFDWIWGVVGIVSLGVMLMVGIKMYKRIRHKDKT